jgi:hypothetical protein
MAWTTVHMGKSGSCALYLAQRVQCNAHCILEISPIAAKICSFEYCRQNMRNCKYIVYVRDLSSHCVNWKLCAVLAPSLQCRAHWIGDISQLAAQIRSFEYWSLNMWNSIYIVYVRDHSSHCVNWRLYAVSALAPSLQYIARWIVDTSPIATELRIVEYWSLNIGAVTTLYTSGTTVHIA